MEVHVHAGRGGARDAGRAPPLVLVDVGPPFVPRAAVDQVVQRPVKGGGATAQAMEGSVHCVVSSRRLELAYGSPHHLAQAQRVSEVLASGDVYLKKVRFEGPSQARPSQAGPEETIMIVRQVPRDAPEAKAPCWLPWFKTTLQTRVLGA